MGIQDRLNRRFETIEEFAQALSQGLAEDLNIVLTPLQRELTNLKVEFPSGSLTEITPTPTPSALPPVSLVFAVSWPTTFGDVSSAEIVFSITRPRITVQLSDGTSTVVRYPTNELVSAIPGTSLELIAPSYTNLRFIGWFVGNATTPVSTLQNFTYTVPQQNESIKALYVHTQ